MARKSTAVDVQTLALPGIPGRPGRPRKANALTNAQRQARYRARHRPVEVGERMNATVKRLARQFDLTESQVTRELIRFALCNRNWGQTGFPSLVTEKEGGE